LANFLNDVLQKTVGPIFQSGNKLGDAVSVKIDGKLYDGWSSVSIAKSLDQLSPSFTLDIADKWRQTKEPWPFMPGAATAIYIGPNIVINGFIEQLDSNVSNEDRSITVSGRSKVCDIIDSAAIGLRATYANITLRDLAFIYAQDFDIKVTDDSSKAGQKIKKVVVNQGETIFELLDRHARELGVLLTSTPEGDLLITNSGGKLKSVDLINPLQQNILAAVGVTGGLFQGKNVLFAESSFDDTERYQRYLVRSQVQGDNFIKDKNTTCGATYTDPELAGQASSATGTASNARKIFRSRTKYIMAEKSMDNKACLVRAQWEANIRAARAAKVSVTVQGWADGSGNTWDVNQLVNTDLRFVGFQEGQYLITAINYKQDVNSGTLAVITLGRADSYAVEPFVAKEPGKGAGWDPSILGKANNVRDTADLIISGAKKIL